MTTPEPISVVVISEINTIPAQEWDALTTGISFPFVRHAFLSALETSGSVGDHTGWLPCHICIYRNLPEKKLVAAMPCYLKTDSMGEYIFDWAWAQGAQRARIPYYPKLVAAIPYTPATGPRMLTIDADPQERDALRTLLIRAALDLIEQNRLSSFHMLFCLDEEATFLQELSNNKTIPEQLLRRASMQYHWRNQKPDGSVYQDMDDMWQHFSNEPRKQARKERRTAQQKAAELQLSIQEEDASKLTPEECLRIYQLYTSTIDRKWGQPYLTPEFFLQLSSSHLAPSVLLYTARIPTGEIVAMSLSFWQGQHIYGRYWGTSLDENRESDQNNKNIPYLHFEMCYHLLVDKAIKNQWRLVEAGAQGEHKRKRGFVPVCTHSIHAIRHARLHDAIADFVEQESTAIHQRIDVETAHSPYKEGHAPPLPRRAGLFR